MGLQSPGDAALTSTFYSPLTSTDGGFTSSDAAFASSDAAAASDDDEAARIVVSDINPNMLAEGQRRAKQLPPDPLRPRLEWVTADARNLPFDDCSFDLYTIAFGIRNVTRIDEALAEAHRVLRPGGRFLCLEFSQVRSSTLQRVYDAWSFNALPLMGRLVAGDAESYRYLAESIRTFPTPEVLADMFASAGFAQIRVRSLSAGIACIHSGWKLD